MEKQQQLMKMHHDYREKLKKQQEANRSIPKGLKAQHDTHTTHTHLPQSPMTPHRSPRSSKPSKGGVDQDQYAKMLRATYQNMGRIQNKNQMQHSIDVKKFNNTELGRFTWFSLTYCYYVLYTKFTAFLFILLN